MEEKDLLAIRRDMDKKRLEIEKEIEEKRQAVELEIAKKRKELDDRLNNQRNEMLRRHDEQVRNMKRQIDARELASRIEAEFNAGKELVEAGIVGVEPQPMQHAKNLTADADVLMQKVLAATLAQEEAERKAKEEEEAKKKAREEAERKAKEEEEIKRKAQAEAERKAKEEEEAKRKAREEAERKTKEEEAKRKAEEQELLLKAKEEVKKKEEEAKHKTAVEEAVKKAEEKRKKLEETERVKKQKALGKPEESAAILTDTKEENGDEQQDEMKKKSKIHWGRLICFILAVILVALIFFFGTVFVVRYFVQDKDVAVVYPRSRIVTQSGENGEKIEAVANERINVLVMGSDYGDSEAEKDEPKRTDAMMLLSFDPEKERVSVLSIPRDTMVILPGHKLPEKINSAYAFGGVMMAKQTVANLLGVPITHYALADWQAFTKVVDLIGGVDLLVEHDMKYDDPYADLHIDLKQGFQHLNGQQAGQYVRYRSDELGDIGRAQRQQKFLRAALEQMFSVSNVAKIPSLINTVCNYVETDMNIMTMLRAINSVKITGKERLKSSTLGGDFVEENDISYWKTDEAAIRKALQDLEIPSSKLK